MKILNITTDDYANFSHENAKALRSVGADCEDYKTIPHPFNYETQSIILKDSEIIEKILSADIVQIFHTDTTFLEYCKGKKNIVYHTGSRYRQNHNRYNIIFNPLCERCFTDQTEFIGLGMNKETYIATAINTDKLIPIKQPGSKLIIGHYPSNPEVKGTQKIVGMLSSFSKDFDIRIDTTPLPHEQNLKRISECDIYIELFSNEQNGKEYGCYGVTAFEAASMGKIVITQNMHPEVYEKYYGGSIFNCTNDQGQFIKLIEFLKETKSIQSMQDLSREIIVNRHSYKSTGEYILKYIL